MEYKFRGKRKDNNKWVKGSLISWPDGDMEICVLDSKEVHNKFMVIPETVGIHFGWADSDGIDIYTGDQLELFWGNGESTCETVSYSHEYGYFMYGNNPLCELVESNIESKVVDNIHESLNPAGGQSGINNMNIEPKDQEVKEQPADAVAPEQATEENAEEGTTEG